MVTGLPPVTELLTVRSALHKVKVVPLEKLNCESMILTPLLHIYKCSLRMDSSRYEQG